MNFSQIPADWQPARVRIGRTQGPAHILEVEFLGGPLAGRRLEARKLEHITPGRRRLTRMRLRRRRKANRVPCTACGKLSSGQSSFCFSCAGAIKIRQRYGMTYLEAAAAVIMKHAQEENDG